MNRTFLAPGRFAGTLLALLAVLLHAGCDRKPPAKAKGFSQSSSVSIALGEPNKEHGTGLTHAYWAPDGRTTATTLDGQPCRYLKREQGQSGYLYFIIDPTFKKSGFKDVVVEVQYFDQQPGNLSLHFDASKKGRGPDAAYTGAKHSVRLKGSNSWQLAAFELRDPTFQNAQNGGADFRLCVRPPELYIRSVTLTRRDKFETLGQSGAAPKDFSRATTVSVALGEPGHESGHGLQHVYFQKDGPTTTTTLEGMPCRHLTLETGNVGYLCFIIDPTFKKGDIRNVTVEVEYFDHAPGGAFGIEFDSARTQETHSPAYMNAGRVIHLAGAKEWQTAAFSLQDAKFKNSQNSKSDFRIWVTPPELYVSRVTMKRGIKEAAPGQRPAAEADFSKADEVHIALGEEEQEHAAGLRHLDFVSDGLTIQTNLNNVPCRHLKIPRGSVGYFYFNIAPTFKNRNLGALAMEVEYFDDKPGTLAVEFDATPSPEARKMAYVNAGQTVRFRGSHSWRVAKFQIRKATFRNAQNSGADFRLCVFPPDLYVRRVSLRRGLEPADRPHRGALGESRSAGMTN